MIHLQLRPKSTVCTLLRGTSHSPVNWVHGTKGLLADVLRLGSAGGFRPSLVVDVCGGRSDRHLQLVAGLSKRLVLMSGFDAQETWRASIWVRFSIPDLLEGVKTSLHRRVNDGGRS